MALFWLTFGNLFVAFRRYGVAARCFRRAAAIDSHSETIQHSLAHSLYNAGAVREAEPAYGRVLAINPSHGGAAANFATLLQEQNRYAEALAVVDHAIALRDQDPRLHFRRGVILVALGRIEEGLASLRHAVALDDSFTDAVIELGRALAKAGRWEEAVRWLTRALTLRHDAPSAFNLGVALSELDRPEEAEVAFRKAIAFETPPTRLTVEANCRLALTIERQGRGEEAIDCAERLLRRHPEDLIVRSTLNAILVAEGQNDRALTMSRESVRFHPDDLHGYVGLGWALLRSGQAPEALAAFDRAATFGNDVPYVQGGRGAALSALGRHRAALEVFEQLLLADPHYLEQDLAAECYKRSLEQIRRDE